MICNTTLYTDHGTEMLYQRCSYRNMTRRDISSVLGVALFRIRLRHSPRLYFIAAHRTKQQAPKHQSSSSLLAL